MFFWVPHVRCCLANLSFLAFDLWRKVKFFEKILAFLAKNLTPLATTRYTQETISKGAIVSHSTHTHCHAHASPHVHNIPTLTTILSQQQLHDQPS